MLGILHAPCVYRWRMRVIFLILGQRVQRQRALLRRFLGTCGLCICRETRAT